MDFYSDIFQKYILPRLSPLDIGNTLQDFYGTTTIDEDFQDDFTKRAQKFSQRFPDLFFAVSALKKFDDFYKSQKAMFVVNRYNAEFPKDKFLLKTYREFANKKINAKPDVMRYQSVGGTP